MKKLLKAAILVLLAIGTHQVAAQEAVAGDTVIVTWEPVTEQVEGEPIPADDILYGVFMGESTDKYVTVCHRTAETQCETIVPYGTCTNFAARAYQPSTGLSSDLSQPVSHCAVKTQYPPKAMTIRLTFE